MIVLGIESSCDETGVALYCTQRGLLTHRLYSQVAMHAEYGGVVPELAARDHIAFISPLIEAALSDAGLKAKDLQGVAYTQGPGLAGALLVGASVAKAMAFALQIPAIGVHHLEGHLLSPLLSNTPPALPFVALLVSGGHSMLLDVAELGRYTLLGESVDDAAGEAFDKSAKLLGLPYPGGALLAKLAEGGNPKAFDFPRPLLKSGDLMMSFAGLKTAVLTQVKKLEASGELAKRKADLAASFQAAAVAVLSAKALAALAQTGRKTLVVAGGVGANQALRESLNAHTAKLNAQVFYPALQWCTDNGAMIALAGALRLEAGLSDSAASFSVKPRWDLSSLPSVAAG